MRHHLLVKLAAILTFALLAGCRKEFTDQSLQSKLSAGQSVETAENNQLWKERIQQLKASLPAGYEARFEQNAKRLTDFNPYYQEIVNRALQAEPATCVSTGINEWLNNEVADWDADITFMAVTAGMLDFPKYDAMLFENHPSNQSFGVRGSFSQRVYKTDKDLKRFWDIDSRETVTAGLHGSMLRDRNKVIRMNMMLYGYSQADAEVWADLLKSLLDAIPQYRNGDHPIFTFNAFAQDKFFYPPVGVIPDKIVLGDGLLEGLNHLGFGDVAPQAIHAHEFGHHVQYELGLTGNIITPEASRRVELMADAYAAYYLSHARGASMQWKRVQQFLQVFFNMGDCGFSSTGHHGTPAQRNAAAAWGYQVADNAKKQGHILPAEEFARLFEEQLPLIVAQ